MPLPPGNAVLVIRKAWADPSKPFCKIVTQTGLDAERVREIAMHLGLGERPKEKPSRLPHADMGSVSAERRALGGHPLPAGHPFTAISFFGQESRA